MKPEYDQWAENLLQEIYYTPEDLRVSLIKEHLLKAVRRGYTDALENGWWSHQDASLKQQKEAAKLGLIADED